MSIPATVIAGDDGVKGAVLLALEADVVTGRADERPPDDHLSRLRTHVTPVAIVMRGCLVAFHLGEPQLSQCLYQRICIGDLRSQHRKMRHRFFLAPNAWLIHPAISISNSPTSIRRGASPTPMSKRRCQRIIASKNSSHPRSAGEVSPL